MVGGCRAAAEGEQEFPWARREAAGEGQGVWQTLLEAEEGATPCCGRRSSGLAAVWTPPLHTILDVKSMRCLTGLILL